MTSKKENNTLIQFLSTDTLCVYIINSIIQMNRLDILTTYMYMVNKEAYHVNGRVTRYYVQKRGKLLEIELHFEQNQRLRFKIEPGKFLSYIEQLCVFKLLEESICRFCRKDTETTTTTNTSTINQ